MTNNVTIRNIESTDYKTVYSVIREAFWNLYRPGCEEHLLAYNIFNSSDYIPELSFVIEYNDEIIGCILYTKLKVIKRDGAEVNLISFGPVCILPQFHRQGFGRLLIEHSINRAKERGYKAIVIAGYRKHYECYGFIGAKNYGLSMPDGKYYYGIMALQLYENSLKESSGNIFFASCMADPNADEVESFDIAFPQKVKEILPCQKQFEIEAAKLDE